MAISIVLRHALNIQVEFAVGNQMKEMGREGSETAPIFNELKRKRS
jgi:hypothetical protein